MVHRRHILRVTDWNIHEYIEVIKPLCVCVCVFTWTGTVLNVVRMTSLHWCNLSPWPPTCSAAWWRRGRLTADGTHVCFHSASLCLSHQRGHGEADDLDAAVIMALRFKVPMVACVSPRHGASTVPTQECSFNVVLHTWALRDVLLMHG